MKPIAAMLCSIMVMIVMMSATVVLINYLEGDILPDTSPWSFVSYTVLELLK